MLRLNPNPRLRYLAGKDVETWGAAGKKNMDESEFFEYDHRAYNLTSIMLMHTYTSGFVILHQNNKP